MKLHLEIEREDDGRWIAEIPELPGVMAYGKSEKAAVNAALTLALRVLAEKLENGELEAPAPSPAGLDLPLVQA
ncbi:MAG: type II toxin-antitoxin system HicB family antitoxin [Planctomycetes bacterium]|nr:type II toxin-antitoxin system HicB family antitoxin [Planctomycetota bacterium]